MIALNTEDLFGSLVVIGFMTHIAIQVFINIAVVTKHDPTDRIPLPFISYGGTSLAFLMVEMGFVLRRVETDASIRGTNERRAADAAVNQSGT